MKRKRHIIHHPLFWVFVSLVLSVVNAHNVGRYYAEGENFNAGISAFAAVVASIPLARFIYDCICIMILKRMKINLVKELDRAMEEAKKQAKENETHKDK